MDLVKDKSAKLSDKINMEILIRLRLQLSFLNNNKVSYTHG
jgi:hypothetical protein